MADFQYYDGTQWVTLKGSGVDLTSTVGVDTTDCDIGPDDSSGSFTKDGTEVDGVQKYKLNLTLPRGTVVTESNDQPDSTTPCVGDLWIDPDAVTDDDPPIDTKTIAKAWVVFEPTNPVNKVNSYKVSTIGYLQAGVYDVNFESGTLKDPNYISVATADVYAAQTNAITAITRFNTQTVNQVNVVTCDTRSSTQNIINPASVKVVVFDNT